MREMIWTFSTLIALLLVSVVLAVVERSMWPMVWWSIFVEVYCVVRLAFLTVTHMRKSFRM